MMKLKTKQIGTVYPNYAVIADGVVVGIVAKGQVAWHLISANGAREMKPNETGLWFQGTARAPVENSLEQAALALLTLHLESTTN